MEGEKWVMSEWVKVCYASKVGDEVMSEQW